MEGADLQAVQARLARLFAEVLGRAEVGVDQDVFALGADSLQGAQLLARVHEAFGVELTLDELFAAPTAGELAALVVGADASASVGTTAGGGEGAAKAGEAGAEPSAPEAPPARREAPPELAAAPRSGPLPLSFAQRRLWFLHQLEPDNPVHNLAAAVRLDGELRIAALRAALAEIVRRHEALRTGFAAAGEEPEQVIHAAAPLPLPVVDLAGLPAGPRQRAGRGAAAALGRLPFDLARGRVVRAALLRLARDEHELVLAFHHIAADGGSLAVLAGELSALYGALAAGRPSPLPELPLQYADYTLWQRRRLTEAALAPGLAWWRQRLAGELPPLELPADRPRPAVLSHRGAHHERPLGAALAASLARLARGGRATTFMGLLAGFAALLHRYTGEPDLVLGSPVAGRDRAHLEGLIGVFLNNLVLRVDLAGEPSLRQVLARVRETLLGAFAHQEVPFERLVDELRPGRDLSRTPLFQVMFVGQNAPLAPRALAGGLRLSPREIDLGIARFDLAVSMAPMAPMAPIAPVAPIAPATAAGNGAPAADGPRQAGDEAGERAGGRTADRAEEEAGGKPEPEPEPGWLGTWKFSTDLFDAATVARMASHLEELLAAGIAEPDLPVARLAMLSAAERHQLLAAWNDTAAEWPAASRLAAAAGSIGGGGGASAASPASVVSPGPTESTAFPAGGCLHQLIAEQAARTPEAVAVELGGERLIYRELLDRAGALAARLRALGVAADSRVGVAAERSLEMVAGLLGTMMAGAAYLPLDPDYPAERLAYMLEDAGPGALLVQRRLLGRLGPLAEGMATAGRVIDLDLPATWMPPPEEALGGGPEGGPGGGPGVGQRGGSRDAATSLAGGNGSGINGSGRLAAEAAAYTIYTSGSTGRPKGAVVPHRGIVNRLLWMQDAYGLGPGDRVLQKTPYSFDVSVWELFWPLLTGARLVMAPPGAHQDPARLAALVREHRITTLHFVPSLLQVFVEQPGLAAACGSLRRVFASGEALPFELKERFLERLPGVELHNLYGPTEASVDVTFHACQRGGRRRTVPIGRPIANTSILLLDRQLEPVPVGVPGELHIGGVGLARGYLGRPELTAERFVPEPFGRQDGGAPAGGGRLYKTGDLARFRPDGEIEFLGRLDHQVKVRGVRIELGEIEVALARHPGVAAAVVVARARPGGDREAPVAQMTPMAQMAPLAQMTPIAQLAPLARMAAGERRLVAYYVAAGPAPDADELRAFLRRTLPEAMVPAAFVALPRFPLTSSGKVDRRALPAPEQTGARPDRVTVPPRDALERQLLGIWQDVLRVEPIGVLDNFFDLGGHSLLMVTVMARIQKATGVMPPLATLLQQQTIADLAAALRQDQPVAQDAPLVRMQPRGRRQPFFCVHPAGGSVLSFVELARQMAPDQPFYALQADGGGPDGQLGIEDLAASYVTEVLQAQPEGPYSLGGHSFGGVVAYEMARQLQRQGRTVALLALLDAAPAGAEERDAPLDDGALMGNFALQLGLPLEEVLRPPAEVAAMTADEQLAEVLRRAQLRGLAPEQMRHDEARHRLARLAGHIEARKRYVPLPYAGRVTLFRARQQLLAAGPERNPRLADAVRQGLPRVADLEMGWGELAAQGVEVHELPGNHFSMLRPPNVSILAETLRDCLSRVAVAV